MHAYTHAHAHRQDDGGCSEEARPSLCSTRGLALVLEVGEAEASGVAKYQSTMVAALSEALISLGRERGDNDLVRLTGTFSLATHFLIQM